MSLRRLLFALAAFMCAATVVVGTQADSAADTRPSYTVPAGSDVSFQVGPALETPLRAVMLWDATVQWNNTVAWNAEMQRQADERAAQAASAALRRASAQTMTHRSSVSTAASSGGSCGGWLDLVASLWPASQVGTACRVLLCESGGDPSARNPSGAIGLFQLLGHGGTTDPVQNATVAFHLWESNGWSPWVCR